MSDIHSNNKAPTEPVGAFSSCNLNKNRILCNKVIYNAIYLTYNNKSFTNDHNQS